MDWQLSFVINQWQLSSLQFNLRFVPEMLSFGVSASLSARPSWRARFISRAGKCGIVFLGKGKHVILPRVSIYRMEAFVLHGPATAPES